MNTNAFFSQEDRRGAKRWEPGTLGNGKSQPAPDAGQAAARAKAVEVHASAREEGFRAGFEAGGAQAQAQAAQLAQLLIAARSGFAESEQLIAENLLDLALDVARQIVRADLKVRREHLLLVIREAMDCLPQSTPNPKLFLHPNDVDLVKAHIGDEISLGAWRVIEDHRIEPGGCRIISPNCEIDATMATRWKRALAGLGRDSSWVESEPQA